ncbi:hypothetical protein [Streptomyces fractus]|uniref:hypothetical protein n=1 Tax=Streptomyces fractus TaxID=641806 RepID=UPI003CFA269E
MTLERIETARGHRYVLDGAPVMGVTTLIGGGLPKPALVGWAAKRAARYAVDNWRGLAPMVASGEVEAAYEEIRKAPFRERNQAAARGTEVHRFADALSRDAETEVPAELYGYVAACADFLDEWGVRPVLAEAVVGSREHGYAGTLDLVAELPSGRMALFDYKTSASGIWPETALQAAAYRYADFYLDATGGEVAMAGLGIDAAYGVHLRADGFAVHPLEAGEPEAFRGKPHEVTAAILTGNEMGLSPMAALRSFDLIKGTPAMRAHALRALLQSHGHAVWEEESTAVRAVVCGRRAGEAEVHRSEWTIERATDAGLSGKDNWKRQPQAMLLARATAEACRLTAADVLHGVPYAVEELADGGAMGETRTVRRRRKAAAEEPPGSGSESGATLAEAGGPLWSDGATTDG